MQGLTNASLADVLPNLNKGTTRVSRLYSPLNLLNPKPITIKKKLFRQRNQVLRNKPSSTKARDPKKNRRNSLKSPSDDIKIVIQTVEFIQKIEVPTNLDKLSVADNSTINSSYDSNSRPSSKISEERRKDNSVEIRKRLNKPARFLSPYEFQGSVRKKKRTNTIGSNTVDLMMEIAENDKNHFKNELVYSKYRKHRYAKLLPIRFEDSWEWSSHGSVSPERRVRFLDS